MTEKSWPPTMLSWVIPPRDEDDLFEPGVEIEGYRILNVIGKGGMGTVYRALHLLLNREVALKVLAPQFAIREDLVARFLREARALAEISHHGIITIHDVKLNGLRPFIVIEYVRGSSLSALLRERKTLPVEEAVRIGCCIAEALEQAHSRGIIHRDLKPANILLGNEGAVKVADFGLASLLSDAPEARSTRVDTVMGTPGYMSPEQSVNARDVDARSDLYSLGVMLYEMLTGQLPTGRFPRPEEINAAVPRELSDLILRALSHEAAARPVSARAFAEELDLIVPAAGTVVGATDRSGRITSSTESRGDGSPFASTLLEPGADLPPSESVWADRSFASALVGLTGACLASFQVLDTSISAWALASLGPLLALLAIVAGWVGLQGIRRSRGKLLGARFATFGMLMGLWLFFILEASRRYNSAPTVVFLTRFPLVVAAVSCFTLWDWLVRPNDDLGTLFTQRGGRKERIAWLALLLTPAFLLIPFIGLIEPEYVYRGFLFRWVAVGIGPLLYLLLVILPGLKLMDHPSASLKR